MAAAPVTPSWGGPETTSVQLSNGNNTNGVHFIHVAGRQRRTLSEMLCL